MRTELLGSSTSWYVTKYLCVLLAVSSVYSATTTTPVAPKPCNPLTDPATTCSTSTSIKNNSVICLEGIGGGDLALENFLTIIRDNPILDLVFVIDRSQSISCEQYQCSVDLIKRLLQYISSTGDLVIGDHHSHVAILTFGVQDTVVYDGVGVPQQAERLTSCSLESKFPKTVVPTEGSVLSTVLERVESVFGNGNNVRNNQEVKRIMLLVSDGEDTAMAGDAKEIANRIREMPATILGMGQDDGWMTPSRETVMISLSSDSEHYACRYYWNEALIAEVKRQDLKPDKVHVRADGIKTGSCAEVECEYDCACEVISNTYQCYDFPYDNSTTTVTPVVVQSSDLPSWLWPVVGAGGGLLLLLIIITCCCLCYRNRRSRDPPPYPGPDLPTPPVPRRRRKLEIMGAENLYGNCDALDNRHMQSDMNGTQEFYVMPETEEFHEVDHDLPGWTDFLVEEIKLKNLIHLGVHNVTKERWSMTPGVKVQRKEVKDIYKIFVDPRATRKGKPKIDLKLGGNRYRINMGDSSEGSHIIATRKLKDGNEQVAVVVREEHYLLVGIASADQQLVLLSSCQDLSSHFQDIYGTNG